MGYFGGTSERDAELKIIADNIVSTLHLAVPGETLEEKSNRMMVACYVVANINDDHLNINDDHLKPDGDTSMLLKLVAATVFHFLDIAMRTKRRH